MAVITISRQLGSLGTEIAREVAGKLNYAYADKETIGEMLAHFGFGEPEREKFDEKKPPFWDFLSAQRTHFLHSIQGAVYEFARKGQVVIVGRGGQVLLRNVPGTLHVRIFAPFDLRVKRLAQSARVDERHAVRILRQSDYDSAGYLHSFFRIDWNDAGLYDLMINTESLLPTTAVRLIMDSVQSPKIQEGVEKGKEKVGDLALIQKVEAKLVGAFGSQLSYIEVRAERGTVSLRGVLIDPLLKDACERAVAGLEGVTHVENQLAVTPYYRQSD